MDWLLDSADPLSSTAPSDIPHRSATDIATLAKYAERLNADVVGFQEVATPAVAAEVFPPSRYQIYMTADSVLQRTGAAIRRDLKVTRNPDLTDLALVDRQTPHPLRSALDLTLQNGTASLRLLVLHLKTGCWDNPYSEKTHSCPLLRQQFAILHRWITERQSKGEAFAILGDFNRRMTVHDPFFQILMQNSDLNLTSAGYASPCASGSYFIDHIVMGGPALAWSIPQSLKVMLYQPDEKALVSDHCPVSIELTLPQQ